MQQRQPREYGGAIQRVADAQTYNDLIHHTIVFLSLTQGQHTQWTHSRFSSAA